MTQTKKISPEVVRGQAITILGLTRDGDDLSPSDLFFLQCMVNARDGALSERELDRWATLVEKVDGGNYSPEWFCGVQHLQRSDVGYVTWRGVTVEHYSFPPERAAEQVAAAQVLGGVCRRLERDGKKVDSSSVMQLYDDMRCGAEMGANYPRRLVTANWSGTRPLDLRIHTLVAATDEELLAEKQKITDSLNAVDAGVSHGLCLTTRQDYDAVVAAIENTSSSARGHAWRAGVLNDAHPFYGEPAASVGMFASWIDREELVDEAAIYEKYLGVSVSGKTEDQDIALARERFR